MKIHFMKESALSYFKGNIDFHAKRYLSEDNSWVKERYALYCGNEESPFEPMRTEVDEPRMLMSGERPEATDYDNTKILYLALHSISDVQAADERLWAGLAHGELWEYMHYRCKLNENNIKPDKIMNNYFFGHKGRRGLIVHYLSRLWWVGRLTYDERRKDPFEALNYLRTDFGSKVLSLFSSNFTSNPVITRAILTALSEIEGIIGEKLHRKSFLELIRYVNLLGGILILDYLSEEELREKIIHHYFNHKKAV